MMMMMNPRSNIRQIIYTVSNDMMQDELKRILKVKLMA
jgi:hypothetical protein